METNFEKLPIWSPKPKRTTIFTPSKTIELEPEKLPDGNLVNRRIEIVPSAKYGYPTTQTQEYWYAFQKLWHESSIKETGRIEFSRRQIIEDVLGKTYGRQTRRALDLSINQLGTTRFEFDYVIYDKEKDITHRELRKFHLIIEENLTEKKKQNEVVQERCFVVLHPLVVSNLRCGYFKPILLSVVSQLKSDVARLLYRKLDSQFSYYNKYEISTERFFREQGLEGKEYYKPSVRKRLLEKAIQELIKKPTSSGAVIAKYEFAKTADNKDWKLIVRASKGKQVSIPNKGFPVENKEVINVAEKVSDVENHIPHKPKNDDSQTVNAQAIELLRYFSAQFHDKEEEDYSQKSISSAKRAVAKYGLKPCKELVIFAKSETRKTNFNVAVFQGITKYFKAGYEELQKRERIEKLNAEKLAKLHEENARNDHEREFISHYHDYIYELVEALTYEYPNEFEPFRRWEAEEKARNLEGKSGQLLSLAERVFEKDGQRVRRLVNYFKGNSRIRIPTFWEWDEKINPHSLK